MADTRGHAHVQVRAAHGPTFAGETSDGATQVTDEGAASVAAPDDVPADHVWTVPLQYVVRRAHILYRGSPATSPS